MIFGCLTVAALVWVGVGPPIAVLPAAFGVVVVFGCLRTGRPASPGASLLHMKAGLFHARLSRAAI